MSGSTRPLIIIGAPRSGTNMLRDALTTLPGLGTWPCDEINYIWRHGNIHHLDDEFGTDLARPEVCRYIRGQFDRMARRGGFGTIAEKTCANSLRVGFVDRIFPDARFLYIVRDGLDVVGSALLRWKARLDIPYLARKARFIPPGDLMFHAFAYASNRLHRLGSGEKRLAFWGPRFRGLPEALGRHTLPEVCALQWQACVDRAEADLDTMEGTRVYRVHYEDFVRHPSGNLANIYRFLGHEAEPGRIAEAIMGISDRSIGKGRDSIDPRTRERVLALIGGTLRRHGYAD